MKKAVLPFLFLSLSYANAAPLLCANSTKEFTLLKTKWPAAINELPIRMGSSPSTTDLIQLNIADRSNSLLLDSKVVFKGAVYHDQLEVKRLCVDKSTQDIRLLVVNGTEINLQQKQSEYSVDGFKLRVLSKKQSDELNAQINTVSVPASQEPGSTK
ncbi:MAG: hypothetical protein ACXVAX_05400 [Pseudobdellovibrio sp.]